MKKVLLIMALMQIGINVFAQSTKGETAHPIFKHCSTYE